MRRFTPSLNDREKDSLPTECRTSPSERRALTPVRDTSLALASAEPRSNSGDLLSFGYFSTQIFGGWTRAPDCSYMTASGERYSPALTTTLASWCKAPPQCEERENLRRLLQGWGLLSVSRLVWEVGPSGPQSVNPPALGRQTFRFVVESRTRPDYNALGNVDHHTKTERTSRSQVHLSNQPCTYAVTTATFN